MHLESLISLVHFFCRFCCDEQSVEFGISGYGDRGNLPVGAVFPRGKRTSRARACGRQSHRELLSGGRRGDGWHHQRKQLRLFQDTRGRNRTQIQNWGDIFSINIDPCRFVTDQTGESLLSGGWDGASQQYLSSGSCSFSKPPS